MQTVSTISVSDVCFKRFVQLLNLHALHVMKMDLPQTPTLKQWKWIDLHLGEAGFRYASGRELKMYDSEI